MLARCKCVLIAAAVLVLVTAGRADPLETVAVRTARKTVESRLTAIGKCAHCDYQTCKSADFDGVRDYPKGFVLRYTFTVEGNFTSRTSTIDFYFTTLGGLDSVKAIRWTASSTPFETSASGLKELQSHFLKSATGDAMRKAIANANAKGICELQFKELP